MLQDNNVIPPNEKGADNTKKIFPSPGIPTIRKIGTGIFLGLVVLFAMSIAVDQGVSVWVSSLLAIAFIGGFVYYLLIVAPTPYQIHFYHDRLERYESKQDPIIIKWADVVKIKEERFPNGMPVSLSMYKRVGEKGLHRAFIVYRDDMPLFEAMIQSLHEYVPDDTIWKIDITHE